MEYRAHIRGALVAILRVPRRLLFQHWHAKFYFHAFIAAAVGWLVLLLQDDAAVALGLPPVEQYHRNDYPAATANG